MEGYLRGTGMPTTIENQKSVGMGPQVKMGELEEIVCALFGAVERLEGLSWATESIIYTPIPVNDCAAAQSPMESPIMGVRLASAVERLHNIANNIDRTNVAISDKIGNLKLY